MDFLWSKFLDWGAYFVSGAAMFLVSIVNAKFKSQETKMMEIASDVSTLEKNFLKYQLDANKQYVEKVEFIRLDNKLDRIDSKVTDLLTKVLDNSK